MGSWPDEVPIPKPVKPDSVEQWEWDHYQNMDPRRIKPEVRDKVEKAMGWKPEDIAAARALADQVVEALAPKGHVPEAKSVRYRRLKGIAELLGTLGGRVSGYGEYADANVLWAMEAKYQHKANELRADLPADGTEEPGPQT